MSRVLQSCTPWREPLITSPVFKHSWQVVGLYLFEPNGVKYLLVENYYREDKKLTNTTEYSILTALRVVFSQHVYQKFYEQTMDPSMQLKKWLSLLISMDSNLSPIVPGIHKVMAMLSEWWEQSKDFWNNPLTLTWLWWHIELLPYCSAD